MMLMITGKGESIHNKHNEWCICLSPLSHSLSLLPSSCVCVSLLLLCNPFSSCFFFEHICYTVVHNCVNLIWNERESEVCVPSLSFSQQLISSLPSFWSHLPMVTIIPEVICAHLFFLSKGYHNCYSHNLTVSSLLLIGINLSSSCYAW